MAKSSRFLARERTDSFILTMTKAQSVFGEGNFLMLHRASFGITDNIAEAVLLNELASIQQYHDTRRNPGELEEFTRTRDYLCERCHLGYKQLDAARKRLKTKRFIEVNIRMEAFQRRAFYRVDWHRITTALEQAEPTYSAVGTTSSQNGETYAQKGETSSQNRHITTSKKAIKKASKKETTLPSLTSDDAREAVARFGEAYLGKFGAPYGAGPQDVRWAQVILAFGAGPSEIVDVATRAWALNGFWCKQATSLQRLASRWNEVRAELANHGAVADSSSQEWAMEMEAVSAGGAR